MSHDDPQTGAAVAQAATSDTEHTSDCDSMPWGLAENRANPEISECYTKMIDLAYKNIEIQARQVDTIRTRAMTYLGLVSASVASAVGLILKKDLIIEPSQGLLMAGAGILFLISAFLMLKIMGFFDRSTKRQKKDQNWSFLIDTSGLLKNLEGGDRNVTSPKRSVDANRVILDHLIEMERVNATALKPLRSSYKWAFIYATVVLSIWVGLVIHLAA